jgi:hypothetical protein
VLSSEVSEGGGDKATLTVSPRPTVTRSSTDRPSGLRAETTCVPGSTRTLRVPSARADDDCDGSVDEGCCAGGEICDNGRDDDCDEDIDCYDNECGADSYCNARRCRADDMRYRWCSGSCVDTLPAYCVWER